MIGKTIFMNASDNAEEDYLARQPVGCRSTSDNSTPMIARLLSDASKLVTGWVCSVDGGVTI